MSFELYPHQKPAVLYIINHPRCILVARPGRGKTAIALAVIRILRNKGSLSTTLIWTHKRGMDAYRKLTAGLPMVYVEDVYDLAGLREEFERDPNRVFIVNTGLINRQKDEFNSKYRNELDGNEGETVRSFDKRRNSDKTTTTNTNPTTTTSTTIQPSSITTFNLSERSILYSLSKISGLVVLDEIHNYRNYKNFTSSGLAALMKPVRGRVLGMTATPFYSHLEDAYQEYALVDPRIFRSFQSFKDDFLVINPRQSQAYRWVITPTGRRKLLIPTVIPEVVGYKNLDLLKERLKEALFIDPGTDFVMNFTPVVYKLSTARKYVSLVKGEDLADAVRLALAGPNSTFSVLFPKGETVRVVEFPDGRETSYEADPSDVLTGSVILRQGPRGYIRHKVLGKAKELTEADIIARLGALVRYLSTTKEQLRALYSVLDKVLTTSGAVVFCQYLETVSLLEEAFASRYPARNIVTITGGEPDMQGTIDAAGPNSFIIISRVAAQSIDFFYDTLVVYEPVTNPGGLEQLLGRITRLSSVFREVNFFFMVGERTITHYFFQRLLYMVKKNPFASQINIKDVLLPGFDPGKKGTSLRTLKDVLLWRRAYYDEETEDVSDE